MIAPAANPIICAFDTPDRGRARALADQLAGVIGGIKLGLEFVTAQGTKAVREFAEGPLPVFLDLKFHDIPNTVAKAVHSAAALRINLLTVHAAGGREMLEAARFAAQAAEEPPKILAVTVLTSLDANDLAATGILRSPPEQVLRLAGLARDAGCDGVVCSPEEVGMLRTELGPGFLIVVPGIRPTGTEIGNQKRSRTPSEAMHAGADRLVIGRPITAAPDPRAAAEAIVAELAAG